MNRRSRPQPLPTDVRAGASGFTLIEMLVVIALMALVFALVAPNLGAFLPSARLNSSCKQFVARLDFARSQARIEGKRYVVRLELEHGRYRMVRPPEDRVRSDQTDEDLLKDDVDTWKELESEVVFAGAGNNREGMGRHGTFEIVFDENGLTGDQIVVFKLSTDESMVTTVQIQGLTGRCTIVEDGNGHEQRMPDIGEMAF